MAPSLFYVLLCSKVQCSRWQMREIYVLSHFAAGNIHHKQESQPQHLQFTNSREKGDGPKYEEFNLYQLVMTDGAICLRRVGWSQRGC